jgi:endonuclease/exonuclease/phosphatase family metal-dependent hydrolase
MIADSFKPRSIFQSKTRSELRGHDNHWLGAKFSAMISPNADVFILQEVDINAHRTHRLNVAQEIARTLRLNYVFGREFVELTQGSKASPAYHGQATLSRWKISNPRVIRFQRQSDFWKPRWFKPKLQTFQERLGGRIAMATEINLAGASTLCYNLHLESRSNDELRLAQLNEILEDSAKYDSSCLVILAGDLNLNASKPGIAEALARTGFRDAVPSARQRYYSRTSSPRGWPPHRLGISSRPRAGRRGQSSQIRQSLGSLPDFIPIASS